MIWKSGGGMIWKSGGNKWWEAEVKAYVKGERQIQKLVQRWNERCNLRWM